MFLDICEFMVQKIGVANEGSFPVATGQNEKSSSTTGPCVDRHNKFRVNLDRTPLSEQEGAEPHYAALGVLNLSASFWRCVAK